MASCFFVRLHRRNGSTVCALHIRCIAAPLLHKKAQASPAHARAGTPDLKAPALTNLIHLQN